MAVNVNEKVKNVYDDNTINSTNFFVRYTHRNRLKKCLKLVGPRLELGKILDYGCGSGIFISKLNKMKHGFAYGYEPFMVDKYENNLPIYKKLDEILIFAPYKTITIFEVMEHLQWVELTKILERCSEMLSHDGVVIISVLIEIGPTILLKEINRFRISKKWKYGFFEFIGALIFGIHGRRENPDKDFMEHKGFDFRELIRFIKSKGW
jgi:2-polyprenyl-3-methyl-5-hydroxy-6-metoxy-1,4-benzoquinol methylase